MEAKPPKSSVLAMQYTKDSDCGLCHTRKCVRVCVDCVYQPNDEEEEEVCTHYPTTVYVIRLVKSLIEPWLLLEVS